MSVNYHHNTDQIAQILRNAHNPEICKVRKDFFEAEFDFLKPLIQWKNILIAWSGLGHDSFALAEYCKYITWIELIQVFVDEANENLKKIWFTNITFLQWDFLNLDYPDKHFDVTILNMWTIGNFDDKKSVIKSLLRVANKLYFWFREENVKDVPIRLQMYQEEKELRNVLFEIEGTTIKEKISWLESHCTSRQEIEKIGQSLWTKISFYPIFYSFTMTELASM